MLGSLSPMGTPPAQPSTGSAMAMPPAPAGSLAVPKTGGMNMSVGGVMTAQSAGSVQAQQKAKAVSAANATEAAQQPHIINLAAHVKGFWEQAQTAKRDIEKQLIDALYARRGEYTPQKYAEINAQGQPPIYMMLAATKMRQAESLLRDVLIGAGTEKPWTLAPSALPEIPVSLTAQIKAGFQVALEQAIQQGLEPQQSDVNDAMNAAMEQAKEAMRDYADAASQRMEDKMEGQLDDGGFNDAFDQFITDLTTFKTAFLVGPVVKMKAELTWIVGQADPVVTTTEQLTWERADPFDIYPAPWARNISEGPLIHRHRLTRESLSQMIGVDGFDDDSIRTVLDMYGDAGYDHTAAIDSEKARAEGKLTTPATLETGLIEALQYWGSVSGKMLLDWGMPAKQIPDASKEYQVECWLVGTYIIKAQLNPDPLARRPYYACSYEMIPGTVWGNSVYDLMRDCQDMCNASARSLAANLGISSGPQVVVNISRLPPGENVTNMYPWKIWQMLEDPMAGSQKPIDFFQPSSNASELMGVYEKFSTLADEYTGIPKYTVGTEGTPGAGRTASGLSMMMGNASKIIKQVVGCIDIKVIEPLLERLWYYNMRYGTDPDLKGDVKCKARGALSLTTKESVQQARQTFLQATNNPTDLQIMGLDGRAEVLRATAETLQLNTSKIIPPIAVVKAKEAAQQQQQAQAAQQGAQPGQPSQPGQPPGPQQPTAVQPGNTGGASQPGQALMNGAPVTDNFSPPSQ